MRKILICSLLTISGILNGYSQTADCNCGVTKGNHERVFLKDRHKPDAGYKSQTVRIGKMINQWDLPGHYEKDDTTTFPREKKIYKVKGYLRIAKIEDNDCDFHLEIGESESGDHDRIIAEIPNTQEYCSLRDKFIDELKNKFGLNKAVNKEGIVFGEDTDEVPVITITGFGFLDASHKSKKNPKKGNRHGSADVMTLWEIHPVFEVKLEKAE